MKLGVGDAARLLNVPEKEIYRWIKQGVIPAYPVDDQYRFSPAELLEWAIARKMSVNPEMFSQNESGEKELVSLSEALAAGGVHYGVGGMDKGEVLRSVVGLIKLPGEMDRDFLYQVLLAREALGTTAIGEGIAIPHVRNPIVMQMSGPTVSLCFLENAVDFGALDGEPVRILFTSICPTIQAHLHLLSRLGHALRDVEFKKAVVAQEPSEIILGALKKLEERLAKGKSALGELKLGSSE
jgi:PTS system nitrogen regulatory IIA component